MRYLDTILFDIYPYVALTVFFLGNLIRYDYNPYSWRAHSSQILSKKGMGFASNLFHIGIIGIFFGHLIGLLTPHAIYAPFISAPQKQVMAMVMGGIFGLFVLIGGGFLLLRRVFVTRIRKTSSSSDILIILLLVIQVILGLYSIHVSAHHLNGEMMLQLSQWAQDIFCFRGHASQHLMGVPLIFKLHIFLGMTLILLFPFTRLVHIWSMPLRYLVRRYQIVRLRR